MARVVLERRFMRCFSMAWLVSLLGLAGACTAETAAPGPDDKAHGTSVTGASDHVDVLLIVDNSNSMIEEQEALARSLPRLVESITSGDRNGDGKAEFPPAASVRLGVITTDVGLFGAPQVPTCSDYGDRALLTTCDGKPYLELEAGERLTRGDAACLTHVGTGGCGFEQPLWAAGMALDGRNPGFVRDDSVLAVVAVSDEDDCSISDASLLDPNSGEGNLNLRCYLQDGRERADKLNSVSALVGRLVEGREPERVVLGVMGGVPAGLAGHDYGAILSAPEMQPRVSAEDENMLVPACSSERGLAFPSRRLVRAAAELERQGGHATVQSICAPFPVAMDSIAHQVGAATVCGQLTACVSGGGGEHCFAAKCRGDAACDTIRNCVENVGGGVACFEVGCGVTPDLCEKRAECLRSSRDLSCLGIEC